MRRLLPLLLLGCPTSDDLDPSQTLVEDLPALCFRVVTKTVDSGPTDDHWIEQEADRPARGLFVRLRDDEGKIVWNGHVDDGTDGRPGCVLEVPQGAYDVEVVTQASVHGQLVTAGTAASACNARLGSPPQYIHTIPLGTQTLSADEPFVIPRSDDCVGRTLNVLQVIAEALWIHDVGDLGGGFFVSVDDDSSEFSDDVLRISRPSDRTLADASATGHWARKYLITHELAHLVASFAGDRAFRGQDCSWWPLAAAETVCDHPTREAGAGHWTTTLEWDSCAANEGFAHWYAAATWNDPSQTEGRFVYYNRWPGESSYDVIDLVNGTPPRYPRPVAAACDLFEAGLGTETDWMRGFWWLSSADEAFTTRVLIDWVHAANWGDADTAGWLADPSRACVDLSSTAAQVSDGFEAAWIEAAARNQLCGP